MKIAIIYLLISIGWITSSDIILYNNIYLSSLSIGISKGIFFVVMTAIFILFLNKVSNLKLGKSKDNHKIMFKNNPQPMWIHEKSTGIILSVNQAMVYVFGFTEEELLNMNIRELNPVDESLKLKRPSSNYLQHEMLPGVKRFKKKNGEIFFMNTSSHVIEFENVNAKLSMGTDVTKQIENELMIDNMNHEMKLIFDSITDGLIVIGDDFRIKRINDYARNIIQTNDQNIIGRNLLNLLTGNSSEIVKRYFKVAFNTGNSVTFEILYEETNTWYLISAYTYNHSLLLIWKDITEKKQREIELQESLNRYDKLTKVTQDAVWEFNFEKNVITWNNGLYRTFGYADLDTIHTLEEWFSKVHPEDQGWLKEKMDIVFEKKIPEWKSEYRFKCADGNYKFVSDFGFAKYNEEGKPIELVGNMRDIQIEKSFQQEIEKLSLVASKTNNGVIITDVDGNTEWANDAFFRITGYSCEDVIGTEPIENIIRDEDDIEIIDKVKSKMKFGLSFAVDSVKFQKAEKEIWLRLDLTPIIKNRTVERFIIIITNITENKIAQFKIEEQNKKLAEFAWSGSHELRAPVARILGLSSLFNYKQPSDPENSKVLEFINETTSELDDMLKVMLHKCNRLLDKEDFVEER